MCDPSYYFSGQFYMIRQQIYIVRMGKDKSVSHFCHTTQLSFLLHHTAVIFDAFMPRHTAVPLCHATQLSLYATPHSCPFMPHHTAVFLLHHTAVFLPPHTAVFLPDHTPTQYTFYPTTQLAIINTQPHLLPYHTATPFTLPHSHTFYPNTQPHCLPYHTATPFTLTHCHTANPFYHATQLTLLPCYTAISFTLQHS